MNAFLRACLELYGYTSIQFMPRTIIQGGKYQCLEGSLFQRKNLRVKVGFIEPEPAVPKI
jgi:hypothetical protein